MFAAYLIVLNQVLLVRRLEHERVGDSDGFLAARKSNSENGGLEALRHFRAETVSAHVARFSTFIDREDKGKLSTQRWVDDQLALVAVTNLADVTPGAPCPKLEKRMEHCSRTSDSRAVSRVVGAG